MLVRFRGNIKRFPDLTRGNVYRVIGIEADDYRLMNDHGRPYLYPSKAFEVVDARRPREWISSRGDSGEQYAYPPTLNKPGFWEDYFDDRRSAVLKVRTYLDRSTGRKNRRRAG
jgi:hypothetical protein